MATPTPPTTSAPVRPEWLGRWREEILDPGLPIVDPHHHLWDRPGWRYLFDDLLADLASGHNIVATVFVEARAMYRADGPEALRPVGESRVRQRRRGDERERHLSARRASAPGSSVTPTCASAPPSRKCSRPSSAPAAADSAASATAPPGMPTPRSRPRAARRCVDFSPTGRFARASRASRRLASLSTPGSITRRSLS